MGAKLAVDGGAPVRSRPFPAWPHFDDAERSALLRTLEAGSWGRLNLDHGECTAFEGEFAAYHRASAGLAVSNGTHALQLALDVLGVGRGDEVLVPAFMPMPTSNAIRQRGAIPVPVDVDPETYCVDPARLDLARTERTRAVIPVHMGGHVADMDAIPAWAAREGVAMIQDAAHAHGAEWRGRGLGELGCLVTFSFQQSKLMTAGEGGAVLLPSDDMYREAYGRHQLGSTGGLPRTASSNYRMSEFAAAVLRAQLVRLPHQIERRQLRWEQLAALLTKIPGVTPQGRDPRCTKNPLYLPAFTVDPRYHPGISRDRIAEALRAERIPVRRFVPPVYRVPAYWDGPGAGASSVAEFARSCPNSERLAARGLVLAHEVLLGDEADMVDVAHALRKVLEGLRRSFAAAPTEHGVN